MLRHSYAVITLELLWRGHLQALGETNEQQRLTYQRVFGDPLNWVRIRLGHRSATTMALYPHTLQELETRTRLELVPEGAWEPVGFREEGWMERSAVGGRRWSRERGGSARRPRPCGGHARRLLRAASDGGIPRGPRDSGGVVHR
ncbi:hypothetical protein [Streptomyces sp. NPDC051677]|uniref:hypothetical protein n=1 Tax=Streptomyces sp. NPDC051677 TaxID=3365669 RepID=UPI0037D62A0C